MAKPGRFISAQRLEDALKLNGYSKRSFAKVIADETGVSPETARKTLIRSISRFSMDEAYLLRVSKLLNVDPRYIEGLITIKAKSKRQKGRMDSQGNFVPSYREYWVEVEFMPKIAEAIRFPDETLEYLFEKYEITDSQGARYKYEEIGPEYLEKPVVDAIQAYLSQWTIEGFKQYMESDRESRKVTYKIESDEEE